MLTNLGMFASTAKGPRTVCRCSQEHLREISPGKTLPGLANVVCDSPCVAQALGRKTRLTFARWRLKQDDLEVLYRLAFWRKHCGKLGHKTQRWLN